MNHKLTGRRLACVFPWTPFEPTGAWSRFQCMWRFFLEQGADVSLVFLAEGTDISLKKLRIRHPQDFNMVGAVWAFSQKLAASGPRPELRALSQAEISLLLMFEKTLYTEHPSMNGWMEKIVAEHDAIACEYPMLLPALSAHCRQARKPLIATCHDVLFELHGTSSTGRELLRQKEVAALNLADAVVFCTEQERKLFETFKIRGRVVLNTGDACTLTPGQQEDSHKAITAALGLKTPHYVLFVGSAHGPNLEAVSEIRQLRRQVPEVSFVIAGACCPKTAEDNFIAVGPVDGAQLDTLYRGALAVIVPLLRGTGMSVKTYEAFNYAKPVISTPVGARGFSVESGRELLLVGKTSEFPAAIRQLLGDTALRERLGQAARAYAEALDYRTMFQPYAEIVEQLLGPASPPTPSKADRTLFLVDNNLSNKVGHHHNYALSLRSRCRAAGLGFCALVKSKADADVLTELEGVPLFRQGIHEDAAQNPYPADWGSLRATYDFLESNERFARELETGLQNRAGPGDTVFLPNATPRQILGIALLLKKNPVYGLLRFVLMLRYSVNLAVGPLNARKSHLDRETAEQYVFSVEKLMNAAGAPGTVRIATDSHELAREYGALTKRTVEVLPIPHTTDEDTPVPAAAAGVPAKGKSRLRIVFLGDAREEKGFELLPAVARAFSQEPALSRVELVFHAYVSSHYHLKMGTVIEELARLKARNLTLLPSSLPAATYSHLLASADLVLLPYDAATYRSRTSGPFVEAICAGKPVVVPAQSWMSAQLANSGAGKTFLSGNAADLVNAISSVLQNHAVYAQAAETLGTSFRNHHNPDNFLRQLLLTNIPLKRTSKDPDRSCTSVRHPTSNGATHQG